MELGILVGRNPFPLDTRFGPADLPQLGGTNLLSPHELVGDGGEAVTELAVPGDEPASEQGLTFPDLGPARVVGGVGVNAPGLRALSTFGP